MNSVKLILVCFSLVLFGCSEDDPVSSVASFEGGTYNISSTTIHDGDDCSSDDGVSGICFPGFGTPEAECPVGDCNCSVSLPEIANEEACDDVDGDWDGAGCEGDCDATTEAECLAADGGWHSGGFCMNMASGNSINCGADIATQADCIAADGEWIMDEDEGVYECDAVDCEPSDCSGEGLAWVVIGWNLIADTFTSGYTVTFSDDGTLNGFVGENMTGTWTLSGTTITATFTYLGTDSSDSINFEVSGNTVIHEDIEPAHCGDCDSSCNGTDETTCESSGGDWEEAECIELIFTK